MHTSHTMQQSWFTPFLPLLEKTEAKLLEPSTFTTPELRKINSFFFASFTIVSTASPPLQVPEFFPLLKGNDLASPLNMEDKCPISSTIQFPTHNDMRRGVVLPFCRLRNLNIKNSL